MFKYLVLFFIPDPSHGQICSLADQIAEETDVHPSHVWLAPHVTFHRPIVVDDEDAVKKHLADAVARAKRSHITFSGGTDRFDNKDSSYIVLPAQTPLETVLLWAGVHAAFADLPGYERNERDGATLHTTLAEIPAKTCECVWSTVQKFRRERMVIPLTALSLCRKPIEGGRWEKIALFPIPA
ncbi:MAG: 2'-5' RNA ligase family protein [bacterium]|nr:2'-5' RNA ligase family protein [bacterium]